MISVLILLNGLTLALALAFLLLILWYDVRRTVNQFFAIFLILVALWNGGHWLVQVGQLVKLDELLLLIAFAFTQIGFTGSSIAIYILITALIGVHPRHFRLIALGSLNIVITYQLFIILNGASTLQYTTQGLLAGAFYIVFDLVALYLVWRYHRKLHNRGIVLGTVLFVLGQSLGFLNPSLGIVSFSTMVSAIGALIISFAILQRELITPLIQRGTQLESMHRVSVAITRGIATHTLLDDIAKQAVIWLDADASAIFLLNQDQLNTVSTYNIPKHLIRTPLALGEGMTGQVALSKKSAFIENYSRDWRGLSDFATKQSTIGSLICSPLMDNERVLGVLMVMAGKQGRLFSSEDARLLELLCAQVAVVQSHGALFNEQAQLTERLQVAHHQLQTFLTSTQNPVIAVDRHLHLMFSNTAADRLFNIHDDMRQSAITRFLPSQAIPSDYRGVLKQLKQTQVYVYEVALHDKTYLCHVASIGQTRIRGWVAVLNDISQLKELDRLKSEMVRMTSHDLKNPLQAAMANLDLLRDDLGDHQDPEVITSLAKIEKHLNRMHRIISGILDLERVRLASPYELCQAPTLVMEAVDELQDMAHEKQITLQVDLMPNLPDFWADQAQFQRAITNLIENAIKFTPPHGKVCISASYQAPELVFIVQDNGVGIAPEYHHKIFERFYRARQSGVEHVSGSGLGLSLVKAVVESHKGRVWVISQSGQGASFYIAVPSAESSASMA